MVDVAEKMGRAPWFQLGALPIFVSKLFGGGGVPGNLDWKPLLLPPCSGGSRKKERGVLKVLSAKREIFGVTPTSGEKTRENPILSQGKSHLRLLRTVN